jgi:hypothetical protein
VSSEADVRKLAEARGWRLEKQGKHYRMVVANTGTLVAADWSTADGFGLSLADVSKALEAVEP